ALGGAGRGDAAVGRLDHEGELAGAERVGDTDPPGNDLALVLGQAAADRLHVSSAVDQVAHRPGGGEEGGRALDGPALDVAGRVEPAPGRVGEVAAGPLADEGAGR